tara:strand:+ start:3355 stop:3552 length:198 start_codon:yes stop_codon:yes gene_type:complete
MVSLKDILTPTHKGGASEAVVEADRLPKERLSDYVKRKRAEDNLLRDPGRTGSPAYKKLRETRKF